uniref:Uncharacterized protein n=1 Tax=Cyprinus carpio TaxID=7962 RepID=A0A8C1Y7H6_CYPCA
MDLVWFIIIGMCAMNDIASACPENCQCNIESLKPADFATFSETLAMFVAKDSRIVVVEPHTFDQTRNLVALGFSGTMLTSLPQDLFQNLKALSTLTLTNNKLEVLQPSLLTPLVDLNTLDLSRNLLTSLPEDAFQGLEKLGQLMLQRNAIRKLYSSTFQGLSHLKSLFLQQNNLTDIPAGIFDDLVNLEVLHLQENKITQLPANLFSNLPKLKKLYLSNNRLSLLPSLQNNSLPNLPKPFLDSLSINITSLMCYAPPALNGRNIRELKEDDIMVSQTAAETTVDISPESTQAYSEPTERHLPHTSPTKPSDSTTVSKEIEDTSGGNAVGQGLSKDKLIIILAIVCTAVIVGIITCVLWRRNKRGSQDLERQRKRKTNSPNYSQNYYVLKTKKKKKTRKELIKLKESLNMCT